MSTIARDYQSAVALIAANPRGRFTVDADGGIRQESRIKAFFGHREVVQHKLDAAVGEALLTMYERARTQPAGVQPLVEPHQLEVVARFMRAYDEVQASAAVSRQGAEQVAFGGRNPSIPHESSDVGSLRLRALQKILAANDISTGRIVDYVNRLQATASSFSPAALHRFNAVALGGGNVTFRVLFNHPDCLDASVTAEQRYARYQAVVGPFVDAAKAELPRGEGAFVQRKIDEGYSVEDARSYWEMNLMAANQMLDTAADLRHLLRGGEDCLVDLGRYIAKAKEQGLTEDQAMTPIRIWMGSSLDALETVWKEKPELAPPLEEVGLVARLIEKEIPLSDGQSSLLKAYFPPASS